MGGFGSAMKRNIISIHVLYRASELITLIDTLTYLLYKNQGNERRFSYQLEISIYIILLVIPIPLIGQYELEIGSLIPDD